MSKTLVKVLLDLTIPGGPGPLGTVPATPAGELEKILVDGCGDTYTYEVEPLDTFILVDLEEV